MSQEKPVRKTNYTGTFYRHDPEASEYSHYLSGGATKLPVEKDTKDGTTTQVLRDKRFINCSFHPNCAEVPTINCEFIDCEFIGFDGFREEI